MCEYIYCKPCLISICVMTILNFNININVFSQMFSKLSLILSPCPFNIYYAVDHGQSSYWTAKSSFLFLASDHTEADPNYTLGVDFWTKIFCNLKNSG